MQLGYIAHDHNAREQSFVLVPMIEMWRKDTIIEGRWVTTTRDETTDYANDRAAVHNFKSKEDSRWKKGRQDDCLDIWFWCATHHMTPFRKIYANIDDSAKAVIELSDENKQTWKEKALLHYEYVNDMDMPELKNNLILLVKLNKKGLEIKIKNGSVSVTDHKELNRWRHQKYAK